MRPGNPRAALIDPLTFSHRKGFQFHNDLHETE